MAGTSLAEQLQRLTAPQSSAYKYDTRTVSLLFDPKEAALKDRETFYEIGISGLKELIALYEGFRMYEDSLFSVSSKDFERALQPREVNANLDKTLEKFLIQLSPYVLLQSSHKAVEWLIHRYHIHEYNQDAIMGLILPYHQTNIFVRFVQLLDLKSSNRWAWLKPIKESGVQITREILVKQCSSNMDLLQLISNNTSKYVQEFGDRGSQLNTVFAFFCSTATTTISLYIKKKKLREPIINAILPTIVKGMESPIEDFRLSSYIVLGVLASDSKLKASIFNMIVSKLFTADMDLSFRVVLLINLLYNTQEHITKLPEVVAHISVDIMNNLCVYLKRLTNENISIQSFVLAFLSSVLPLVQADGEEFRIYSQLPTILLDEVDLKNQNPEKIIRCIIESVKPFEDSIPEGDDGSDIEIVDETGFSEKVLLWYSELLQNLEIKYPDPFDKVVKELMSSNSPLSAKKRKYLSKVLGFKPAVAHKIGEAYLFENLNSFNPEKRIQAVQYIAQQFESFKENNMDFVKESVINRFQDDNLVVVNAVLEFPDELLREVLEVESITDIFVKIISKKSAKWIPIINKTILKFCALDLLPVNHYTVLALMPYLFPYDEKSAQITWHILTSPWGKKFSFTKTIKNLQKSYKDNHEVLSQTVFNALFKDSVDFDNVLNVYQLNKENTTDVCFYLLLKSCSLKKASVEDITNLLNLLLDSIENRKIFSSDKCQEFTHEIMSEFILKCKQDTILFEVMEYLFSKIITDMNVQKIQTPWCNVCGTPDEILVRKIYEICISGCSLLSYSVNYSKLLKILLDKFFRNAKEKFEFIANVACGHILYATDPRDVINPELQLRSMKLLGNYVAVQEDANWIYESDVVITLLLFNLNNRIGLIRQSAIDLINSILKNLPDKKLVYVQLMKELVEHRSELVIDPEQILQVLHKILTQQTIGNKTFGKNCLMKLTGILSSKAPSHVKAGLLKILGNFNSANAFSLMAPALDNIQETLKQNQSNKKILDIYESNLLKSVYGHINEVTVTALSNKELWASVAFGLTEYRECVDDEDQTLSSPCVLIMKQITEDVFKKAPDDMTSEIVRLITSAGTFSNNPAISSAASKAMKRIHIKYADFKPILEGMVNVDDPAKNGPKKKKSSVAMLSYELTETNEWKLGLTLLEYLQSKKKMTVDNSFVTILFNLFNKCLRFEEQSFVEYTKQLILSSLWYFCKKFVDSQDSEQVKSLKSLFTVESIVQCIRGTQNPQTHHHALILLSHAAYMMPEQVLHHTMEIFTFMGSSVLRHDDAYSFQIIINIIENLVPILVKLDKAVEEYSEKELQLLQNRVVPVLRIFADVVLHVPEHRRLPLYKKLLETLGASQFLWVFLALVLETHVAHFNEPKEDKPQKRTLADQESPINRLDFGQSIILEFPPEIGLESFIKLLVYMKTLPLQKDEDAMDTDVDPRDIFSVNGHTANQLRHYKYIIVTFMNTCLASSRFIQHCSVTTDNPIMENHYKTLIVNILTFIQSIYKYDDEKTAKYRRVMLHHSYDLLDNTNNLLSAPMFVSVIRGLLKHTLVTVRRKSMELLNTKIQFSPEMFNEVNPDMIFSLLPVLLEIIQTIETKDDTLSETAAQELEANQQTALLSLKLLTRMLAAKNPEPFQIVLEYVTNVTCNPNISGNVMASVVLCLAELCSNLKAHALSSMRKFMPALIKVLKKQRKAETPELILLSTVTAISKIVESLPLFLSPYLQKILYEYSILLAKWQNCDQECNKVSAIVSKLSQIKKKIAVSIPPRVLIPVANETHRLLLEKQNFDAIGPVMSVLADSFKNVTTADFKALQQDLTAFFLTALQLRSDAVDQNIDAEVIDRAEDEVVNALVSLVLKLSETSFRPFYFKIYDWAIRNNVEGHKDRAITFYRLSSAIADKLKGLFVLFAGHFITNASTLLDACNLSKTEHLYFDSSDKCIALVNYIIKTMHIVFLYDSQSFLNKDRFETLVQPIVDQLENTVGGIESFKKRAKESVIPCIAQFAVATADDSLWKLLNYQILLKIRHNDAEIRLIALDCLVAMATQLGSSWLPLLAESVPFLAELLEDGDFRIETATKEAIRKLEQILGEPLEKYF